jgi:hypothetical protein
LEHLASPDVSCEATELGKESYLGQKAKLQQAMDAFERRVRPDELSEGSAASGAPRVTEAVEAEPGGALTTTQQLRPAVSPSPKPITIDADIVPGRAIQSIEVHCKIEYS